MYTDQWIKVSSSNLELVFYSASDDKLKIQFHSGRIYEYYRISFQLYENLLNASSKGSYFHSRIKDKFTCHRIK